MEESYLALSAKNVITYLHNNDHYSEISNSLLFVHQQVQYLFRVFCRLRPGVPILALHGKQQQMKRMEVYNDFVRKKSAVLFATDIAARGLGT